MRVIKKIGQGGFGNVEKVELDDGTVCARKVFSPNQPLTTELLENVKKRFAREVKIQSAIEHPNIYSLQMKSSGSASQPRLKELTSGQ